MSGSVSGVVENCHFKNASTSISLQGETRQDNLLLKNTTFRHNKNNVKGAALQVTRSTVRVIRGEFNSNEALEGSALSLAQGAAHLYFTNLHHNQAKIRGGALHVDSGSLLHLVKCNCTDNNAGMVTAENNVGEGGCLYAEGTGTQVALEQVLFQRNTALTYGGAAWLQQLDMAWARGTSFHQNSAGHMQTSNSDNWLNLSFPSTPSLRPVAGGGAVYLLGTVLNASDLTFDFNNVFGADGWGGGLLVSSCPHLALISTDFSNNAAHFGGGLAAFCPFSEGNQNEYCESVAVVNTSLRHNRASFGGGLGLFQQCSACSECSSRLNFTGMELFIQNNSAESCGGAVFASGATSHFAQTHFESNTAADNGALYYYSSDCAKDFFSSGAINPDAMGTLHSDVSAQTLSTQTLFLKLDPTCTVVNNSMTKDKENMAVIATDGQFSLFKIINSSDSSLPVMTSTYADSLATSMTSGETLAGVLLVAMSDFFGQPVPYIAWHWTEESTESVSLTTQQMAYNLEEGPTRVATQEARIVYPSIMLKGSPTVDLTGNYTDPHELVLSFRAFAYVNHFSNHYSFLHPAVLSVHLAACPVGTFYALNSRTCADCEAGYFTSANKLSSRVGKGLDSNRCLMCDAGYFSNSSRAGFCFTCPLGSAQPESASTTCAFPCAPGTFGDNEGLAACVSCPLGTFARQQGARACTNCTTGTFADATGLTACRFADPGFYVNQPGMSMPSRCGINEASVEKGTTACQPCSPFAWTNLAGASRCEKCLDGFSPLFTDFGQPFRKHQVCVACTEGLSCAAGQPTAQDGYYLVIEKSSGAASALSCVPTHACINNTCAPKRRLPIEENPLCAHCQEGFYEWGQECLPCDDGGTFKWFLLLFLVSQLYVTMVHYLSQNSSSRSGRFKTILYYTSSANLLFSSTNDDLMSTWVRRLTGAIDFEITASAGSNCVAAWSAETQLFFRALLPLLLILQLFLLALVTFFIEKIQDMRGNRDRSTRGRVLQAQSFGTGWSINPFLRTLLALLIFCSTQICDVCMTYLNCLEVSPELGSVVETVPGISCNTQSYQTGLLYIIPLLLFFTLGFPLFLILYLRKRKSSLYLFTANRTYHDKKPHQRVLGAASHHGFLPLGSLASKIGTVYEMYREEFYWYQVWALLRRSLMVALAVGLSSSSFLRFQALTLFFFCALLVHLLYKPFLWKWDNQAESLALCSLVTLSLLCGATTASSSSSQVDVALAWIAVAFFFMTLFYLVCRWLYEMAQVGKPTGGLVRHSTSPMEKGEGTTTGQADSKWGNEVEMGALKQTREEEEEEEEEEKDESALAWEPEPEGGQGADVDKSVAGERGVLDAQEANLPYPPLSITPVQEAGPPSGEHPAVGLATDQVGD